MPLSSMQQLEMHTRTSPRTEIRVGIGANSTALIEVN